MTKATRHALLTDTFIGRVMGAVVYLPFAVPLMYLRPFIGEFATEQCRAITLIVCGVASIPIALIAKHRSGGKLSPLLWLFVIYSLVLVISSLLSADKSVAFLGIYGDYQGLLVQLASMIIGYCTSLKLGTKGFWGVVGSILGIVCVLSVLTDLPNIVQGFRLSGLLMDDTNMSLYAAVAVGINLALIYFEPNASQALRRTRSVFVAISLLAVVLSSSRVGLVVCVLALLIVVIAERRALKWMIACLAAIAVLAAGSYFFVSPVQRLSNPQRVYAGISYRLELYKWSIELSKPSLIGKGTSQVFEVFYSRNQVVPPQAIKDTLLYSHNPIWYSHCQWIDLYIEYGIIGLFLFTIMFSVGFISSLRPVYRAAIQHKKLSIDQVGLAIIMTMASLDLLVNTPSIELTPLIFLAIFGGFRILHEV